MLVGLGEAFAIMPALELMIMSVRRRRKKLSVAREVSRLIPSAQDGQGAKPASPQPSLNSRLAAVMNFATAFGEVRACLSIIGVGA